MNCLMNSQPLAASVATGGMPMDHPEAASPVTLIPNAIIAAATADTTRFTIPESAVSQRNAGHRLSHSIVYTTTAPVVRCVMTSLVGSMPVLSIYAPTRVALHRHQGGLTQLRFSEQHHPPLGARHRDRRLPKHFWGCQQEPMLDLIRMGHQGNAHLRRPSAWTG